MAQDEQKNQQDEKEIEVLTTCIEALKTIDDPDAMRRIMEYLNHRFMPR
jgi:hypothetical protein